MWTKRYILFPTKEEYFKTKHPIATLSMLIPMILYYLLIAFSGVDTHNWWIIVGALGCIALGIGFAYTFAVKRKIYEKGLFPVLCMLFGGAILVVSLFLVLR